MNKTKTINFHINWKCNADCIYCFRPEGRELAFKDKCEIIAGISQLPGGKRRINFAGGEPTLVNELPELLEYTKSLGLETSVITNGSVMCRLGIQRYAPHLDMLGVSVDSACANTNKLLKRPPIRAEELIKLATEIHASSTPLKVNTVVTSCNVSEDLSDLLKTLKPQRWKIFRAISVAGTNDIGSEPWRVSDRQFDEFVSRHRHLRASGIDMIVENDDDLRGSYVMISPDGRFYDSTLGGYQYSDQILDVGLETAFNQVVFLPGKFLDRGGDFRIDQYLPSP